MELLQKTKQRAKKAEVGYFLLLRRAGVLAARRRRPRDSLGQTLLHQRPLSGQVQQAQGVRRRRRGGALLLRLGHRAVHRRP